MDWVLDVVCENGVVDVFLLWLELVVGLVIGDVLLLLFVDWMDLWNGVSGVFGCGEDLRSEILFELVFDWLVCVDFW